jgi:MFS family permease
MVELNKLKPKIMTETNTTVSEEAPKQLGPARLGFPMLLLKTLAGLAGGGIGSLILLVIAVLAATIIAPLTDPTIAADGVSPVFVFVVSIMGFLASTIGNILSVLFLSLTEREKYTKTSTTIYHIFIISIVMFILMVPVYFIAASINVNLAVFAIALHVILSAMASSLIMEMVSNTKYSLIGLYGTIFSIVMSAAILFGMYSGTSTAVVLFLALPIVWGSMAFIYSVFSMIYGWVVDLYDEDFLSLEINFGQDYGKAVESDKPVAPRAKDEAGAEFLRHN